MTAKLLALAAAFALLTWQVRPGGALVVLDGRVNAAIAPLRRPLALSAFAWLTQVGTGAAGTAIAAVASGLMWTGPRAGLVWPLWLVFVGAQATTWSLKFVVARVRPPFIEGVTAASPSFPSAHATVSLAVYGFMALAIAADLPSAGQRAAAFWAAGALVALIGFSRLLLSLHYLTDILGGALVAAFWLVLGWRIARGV